MVVDEPVVSYLLVEPGEVPDNVRARVTKSVAYTSHHQLPGRQTAGRFVQGAEIREGATDVHDKINLLACFDTHVLQSHVGLEGRHALADERIHLVFDLIGQVRGRGTPAF